MVVVSTAAGTGFVFRCPNADVVWYAVLNSYQGPSSAVLFTELVSYPTYLDAVTSMWGKYDAPASGPWWDDLVTRTKAAGFAIPITVPKNGTATTRPTYPVVNGVRYTKVAGSAPVGLPCDCQRWRGVVGSALYCSVSVGTASVCSLATP